MGFGFDIANTLIAAAGLLLASLPFFKNGTHRKAALYPQSGADINNKFQARFGRVTETTGVAK